MDVIESSTFETSYLRIQAKLFVLCYIGTIAAPQEVARNGVGEVYATI
jgi:hypothetical protein